MTIQIIYLVIVLIELLYSAARHGDRKDDQRYNVIHTIIGNGLMIGLLYGCGFFDPLTK